MYSSQEKFEMGSALTIKEAKKGTFISHCVCGILIILVCAVIACVGLIVHFAVPKPDCKCDCSGVTPISPEAQWQECLAISETRGECACPSSWTTTKASPMTSSPMVPETSPTTPDVSTPAPTSAPRILNNRLNSTVVPYHYDIELKPYVYDGETTFGLDGSVTMYMTCEMATDVVVFHTDQITVNESSIVFQDDAANQIAVTRWSYDIDRQHFKLYLAETLVVSTNYMLSMTYNGTLLHSDYEGFYLSSYTPMASPNTTRYLATTQFEQTGARRAVPCFDEPAMKATYNVTLVRKAAWSSLSNMNILYNETRGDGWVADVYNKTVVMSTYLLAFVVCDFEYKERTTPRGTMFRIWARSDYIDYVDYALEVSGEIMEFLEDYYNITYPLPYTDQIVIPDFRSGAMENWGLVTYRNTRMLFNPKYCRQADKFSIAEVIVHELAHQWFGNLVTMEWWDDIWLNEGFATYFESPGVDAVEPTWKMNQIALRVAQSIMRRDGGDSQPVFVKDIEHHTELGKAFASITYSKGGSVIRMMKYFLGEETFKRGLSEYLKKYAYSNAVHEDLYKVLSDQAIMDQVDSWDNKTTNFSNIMDTWIEQQGYPVLTVTNNYDGKVTFKQDHFLYDANITLKDESPFGSYMWNIPIVYQTSAGVDKVWMYMNEKEATKPVAAAPTDMSKWFLVNVEGQGYYRVKYNLENWDAILAQLSADNSAFAVENRAQIVDDAFQMARAGQLSEMQALRTTIYLGSEQEYMPWYAAYVGLDYIDLMLRSTVTYGDYSKYMLGRIAPAYGFVGWDDSSATEHTEKYLRIIILREACRNRHKPCLDESVKQFAAYMTNSTTNPISTNLRRIVYCNAIRNGGAAEWEFIFNLYVTLGNSLDYIAYERGAQGDALACTNEEWLLRKYMEYGYNNDIDVIVQRVARNEAGWRMVWDTADQNIGSDGKSLNFWANVMTALTEKFNTVQEKAKLQALADKHRGKGLDAYMTTLLNRVQTNIDWMATNFNDIKMFLDQQNAGSYAQSYSLSTSSQKSSIRGHVDLTVQGEVPYLDIRGDVDMPYEFTSRVL
ncbi:unnamed protein product [Owenia fusiformis]|uniref:glutamyl aminopeptidase n=1 Tax=Owenia fusiformis TaxID=6347 RepID=A0A8S4NIB1_OWEFU|nr:unnamed protein product [Owenia fusiformis]